MEEEFTKQDFRKLRKKDLIHLVEGGNITKPNLKRLFNFRQNTGKTIQMEQSPVMLAVISLDISDWRYNGKLR